MRTPLFPDSWWKRTALRSSALYSLTGTVTIPKLIAPVHIARGIRPSTTTKQRPETPLQRPWPHPKGLSAAPPAGPRADCSSGDRRSLRQARERLAELGLGELRVLELARQ